MSKTNNFIDRYENDHLQLTREAHRRVENLWNEFKPSQTIDFWIHQAKQCGIDKVALEMMTEHLKARANEQVLQLSKCLLTALDNLNPKSCAELKTFEDCDDEQKINESLHLHKLWSGVVEFVRYRSGLSFISADQTEMKKLKNSPISPTEIGGKYFSHHCYDWEAISRNAEDLPF